MSGFWSGRRPAHHISVEARDDGGKQIDL